MPEYEVAVDVAMREAEGLLEMFSALLRIAQVKGASPRAGFRAVDLRAVTDSVVDAYRPDAEEAAHRLIATVAPGIIVHGDQKLLTQAVASLMENALRHTPVGTLIGVLLSRNAAGDGLAVVDNGPGVVPGDMPRLVYRF